MFILGSLERTYDYEDLLLVLIKLFSLGVTAEALWAIISLKSAILPPNGASWSKISGRMGRPHQPFFFSEN